MDSNSQGYYGTRICDPRPPTLSLRGRLMTTYHLWHKTRTMTIPSLFRWPRLSQHLYLLLSTLTLTFVHRGVMNPTLLLSQLQLLSPHTGMVKPGALGRAISRLHLLSQPTEMAEPGALGRAEMQLYY